MKLKKIAIQHPIEMRKFFTLNIPPIDYSTLYNW